MKRESKLTKLVKKIIKEEIEDFQDTGGRRKFPKSGVQVKIALKKGNEDAIAKMIGVKNKYDFHDDNLQKLFDYITNTYSTQEITNYMKSVGGNGLPLYPSNTVSEENVEYPKELALALIARKDDAESLTDLWNVYYRSTSLSNGAKQVFLKHMMDNPSTGGIMYGHTKTFEGSVMGDDGDYDSNEIKKELKFRGAYKSPEILKFLKVNYPEYLP